MKTNNDLSVVKGTISYEITNNHVEYEEILADTTKLFAAKKAEVIAKLEKNTKDCPSRRTIIYKLRCQNTPNGILTFLWNVALAGGQMARIR